MKALLILLLLVSPTLAGDRPNILWITSEDNAWNWLGCYGNTEAETPRLDALAADGTLFTHAYSNAPVCAVARSTILNGAYAVTPPIFPPSGPVQRLFQELDRDVRKPHEKPSIGLLLCASKDAEVIEYALSRSHRRSLRNTKPNCRTKSSSKPNSTSSTNSPSANPPTSELCSLTTHLPHVRPDARNEAGPSSKMRIY